MRITRLRLPQGVGLPVQQLPLVDAAIVWPGYFRTMGIQLQSGREFNDTDSPDAASVAIVNETFVRRYSPDKSPIGQSFEVGFPVPSTVTIVGIVSDIRSRTLGDIARPMVYTVGVQDPLGWQTATAVVRLSAAGANTPRQLTEAMRSIDPTVPVYDVQPLSTRIAAVLILPRYAAAAFGSVGLIALVLVSVGLSGVVAYWAAQRTREIGIRVAMGGQPAQIVWLVLRQSLLPAIAGVVVGSILAVVAARAMTAVLYGISAADPPTYVASGLTVALAATLAALPSAVRALRLVPAATLRQQ
jgi:putative ABC transport system permease protein